MALGNAIDYLLNELKFHIPQEVLLLAFNPAEHNNRSLDSIIKEKIIINKVLRDCNLYSGKIKNITLKQEWLIEQNVDTPFYYPNCMLYRIPPEAREYRDILEAIDISPPAMTYDTFFGYPRTVPIMAEEMITSRSGSREFLTPIPTVLDDNVIKLEPASPMHIDWIVSVLLKYDENFTNIKPHILKPLSKLVILACKMYIYTNLWEKVQRGVLFGGKEVPYLKDLLEEYKDAHEQYEETLKQFRGAALFDEDSFLDLVSMMV